ncbi:MAG TPA: CDP-alcohol phosphatidyltransferase family protein [Gaiellaceae bacterium]|nr:CDP-alcohol phosphatidyltransferase family protein [Gaiellaceae bacterium]
MSSSTENPQVSTRASLHERRAGREIALEWIFRPLAGALVPWLLRLRIPPPVVVLANATAGLAGAVALVRGELVVAAVLLQAKTVLDNADGQLARVTGRVTLAGRYLDTEADLVVNAALFVALGRVTGQPWLALVAFLALTLLLAADYNLSELYRDSRGTAQSPLAASGGRIENLLRVIYRIVFAPLDGLVRGLSARRLEQTLAGDSASEPVTLAYNDRGTVTVLANLGLSTQLAVLGLCLVIAEPALYLWVTLGSLVLLPVLQLRREHLARHASRPRRGA